MFILIVGGGKVGTYLARGLIKQQHEVVVIEKDARKAQMMTNLLETDVAIVGDGCDPNVLMQAGVARAAVMSRVCPSGPWDAGSTSAPAAGKE